MTPRQRRQRLIVNLTEVGREGRRFYTFYRGYQARQRNRPGNPYKPGTADHACWEAGWKYACDLPDRQAGEETAREPSRS